MTRIRISLPSLILSALILCASAAFPNIASANQERSQSAIPQKAFKVAQACGWYAVANCHRNVQAAIASRSRLGQGFVVNTRDYPNFRNGWWCVIGGPYGRQGAANVAASWRAIVPSAYSKRGC